MSNLILIDQAYLSLVNGSFGSNGMPMPYMQEIFLIECHIAGTSYLDLEEIEPNLNIDQLLITRREPENKYDTFAIMLLSQKGEKLGYIPRDRNEILARLMDAGKIIIGKIVDKKWYESWLKLSIRVYMRDI
ncbi:MAG: HIRAN domain-containing protein [Candidatus Kapabacteria bacterium]|nr:HIRAN domain-containing protein [Candidatus Kapabacteria bacterium]